MSKRISHPVRVGVLGAGAWAEFAHLPGYKRDPRCELVAIADPMVDRARAFAEKFGIPNAYASHEELIARDDIDVVDVCTPSATALRAGVGGAGGRQARALREAGRLRLSRHPRAAALAREKGLKTKLGFTFRYSPGHAVHEDADR